VESPQTGNNWRPRTSALPWVPQDV
jgi:hypothetical protein